MMGNFLTTLGNTPEQDRAMFEDLGLNVARQTDNGANPRPDNRSGWLAGETPDVVGGGARGRRAGARRASLGSVVTAAIRAQAPRPEHVPTARPPATREVVSMIEIEARLSELKALGLHRRTRLVSGPQGPHVLLDGKPVLLLCSNNYLGLADHPRVRAGGGGRRDALGRRRRRVAARVGHDDRSTAGSRSAWPSSSAARARCCSARATSPTPA